MSTTRLCSRAGCTDAARWLVVWRNPRIHAADRRKLWGACDAHADVLRDHLAARGFPVAVESFAGADAAQGDEAALGDGPALRDEAARR